MLNQKINQQLSVAKNILLTVVLSYVLSTQVMAVPVGADDFRISNMGPDGDPDYFAVTSAIAYNAINNEYLIVWRGRDDIASLAVNEAEIFGKIINADTGAVVVADFRISTMGPDGNAAFGVDRPEVVWNATENEYVVVWQGEDDTGTLVQDEIEIFAQGVSDDGNLLLLDDLRISDMGPDGVTTFHAFRPAIAWNSQANEYFIVWSGYDVSNGMSVRHNIFGQRLDATLSPIGSDLLISDTVGPNTVDINSEAVAIAYNATDNRYLVAWQSEGNLTSAIEYEIFAQSLGADGSRLLTNDLRVSDMGPNDSSLYGVVNPAVTWNATENEYFVVWTGEDDVGTLVNNEFEIFGQRLDGNASEVGVNDMRLSNMGPDASTTYVARNPDIKWSSADNQYFVAWHGDDDSGSLVSQEFEIYGRRLNIDGSFIEADAVRLSDMGSDGDADIDATFAAVAYNSVQNQYLTVWHGDDDTPPLSGDGEFEIFGQGFASSAIQSAVLRFSAAQYTAEESVGSITIDVNRVGDTTNMITVDYASSDGSANAPADYTIVNGTLTFDIGESSQSFTVTINADDTAEPDETVLLSLSSPLATSGSVSLDSAQSTATLTIQGTDDTSTESESGGGSGAFSLMTSMMLFLAGLACRRRWAFRPM